MKKLLLILLCLPLLFSSCEEDTPDINNNGNASNSTACGTASFNLNASILSYNGLNPISGCSESYLYITNGNTTGVTLTLTSYTSNQTDYLITISYTSINEISIGETYLANITSPIAMSFSDYDNNTVITYTNSNGPTNLNGSLKLTNIDQANKKISGTFSFTGYTTNIPTTQINLSNGYFTDIPINIIN